MLRWMHSLSLSVSLSVSLSLCLSLSVSLSLSLSLSLLHTSKDPGHKHGNKRREHTFGFAGKDYKTVSCMDFGGIWCNLGISSQFWIGRVRTHSSLFNIRTYPIALLWYINTTPYRNLHDMIRHNQQHNIYSYSHKKEDEFNLKNIM